MLAVGVHRDQVKGFTATRDPNATRGVSWRVSRGGFGARRTARGATTVASDDMVATRSGHRLEACLERRAEPRDASGPVGRTLRGDQGRGDDQQLREHVLTPRFPRSGGKRSQPRRRGRPRRRRLQRSHACVHAIGARRTTMRSRRARPVWPRTRVSRAHSWTHATSVSEPAPAAREIRA